MQLPFPILKRMRGNSQHEKASGHAVFADRLKFMKCFLSQKRVFLLHKNNVASEDLLYIHQNNSYGQIQAIVHQK